MSSQEPQEKDTFETWAKIFKGDRSTPTPVPEDVKSLYKLRESVPMGFGPYPGHNEKWRSELLFYLRDLLDTLRNHHAKVEERLENLEKQNSEREERLESLENRINEQENSLAILVSRLSNVVVNVVHDDFVSPLQEAPRAI